jgi:hypothetical protein
MLDKEGNCLLCGYNHALGDCELDKSKNKYHRREDYTPELMLVNLPKDGYTSTGEGGLAFYFVIPSKEFNNDRRCCLPGESFEWIEPECCLHRLFLKNQPLDGGLLIGSTGLSLWSEFKGEYFRPEYKDLTDTGKQLYKLLKQLYGQVFIVTKLDT